jgi:hypothetical protein
MGNGETRKVNVEEAKRRLLDPPPEAYRRPVLEENAAWLVLGAFILGFFTGTPRRITRLFGLGFKVMTSPMLQKALVPLVLNAAARSRR